MPDTFTIPEQLPIDAESFYKALVDINTVRLVHFHGGPDKADGLLQEAVLALSESLGGGWVAAHDLEPGHLTPLGERLERDAATAAVAWFESLADCYREEAEGASG